MAKPAAIHITKKPPIKNSNVLKTKPSFVIVLSMVAASWLQANMGTADNTAAPLIIFAHFGIFNPSSS